MCRGKLFLRRELILKLTKHRTRVAAMTNQSRVGSYATSKIYETSSNASTNNHDAKKIMIKTAILSLRLNFVSLEAPSLR